VGKPLKPASQQAFSIQTLAHRYDNSPQGRQAIQKYIRKVAWGVRIGGKNPIRESTGSKMNYQLDFVTPGIIPCEAI